MEMTRGFTRNVEDFVCAHCGTPVEGNGYTNHCPNCLYSMHVDVQPGDRLATCQGLMAPVRVEPGKEGYKILHRCNLCGYEKRNQSAPEDNFEALLKVIDQETKMSKPY